MGHKRSYSEQLRAFRMPRCETMSTPLRHAVFWPCYTWKSSSFRYEVTGRKWQFYSVQEAPLCKQLSSKWWRMKADSCSSQIHLQQSCYCTCNQCMHQSIGSLFYHNLSQHHYNFIVWREIASCNNLDSLSGITTTWCLRVLKHAVAKLLSNCIFCSTQLSCQIHISLFAGGVCICSSLCRDFYEDILK